MRICRPARGLDFGICGVGIPDPEIILDRAVEQIGILIDHSDLAADILKRLIAGIMPANPDCHGRFIIAINIKDSVVILVFRKAIIHGVLQSYASH